MRKFLIPALIFCFGTGSAHADVIKSAPDHFTLQQTADSEISPEDLWNKLIDPAAWWHHSYSGDVRHMSLDLKVGGLWSEDWADGSAFHGRVLYINNGKQLRLDAPFGPLQEMAITDVWTITITPNETGGSTVTFDETAIGSSLSGLDQIAPVVDQVKTEALERLVSKNPKPLHLETK